MAVELSPFAEALVVCGAITAGTTAITVAVCLILGGVAKQKGSKVSPWKLAAEQGAPLGALAGLVVAIIELIPG